MVPTRLTVWLLVLGLVLWLAGFLVPLAAGPLGIERPDEALTGVRLFVAAFDGGVLLLMVLDALLAWQATRPGRLTLRRERPARLSLGVDNEVALVLENRGPLPLALVRRAMRRRRPSGPTRSSCRRRSRPAARGGSPIACCRRSAATSPSATRPCAAGVRCGWPASIAPSPRREAVQVYPNLLEVRRYEALAAHHAGPGRRLPRQASARRRPRVQPLPRLHSRRRLPPRELEGDGPARQADHGRLRERAQPGHHLRLDVGRMMAARVGTLTKLDHAINAVLMLTHVSQTFQDNLGLLVFSHTVHLYLPPAKGRAQHARFLQALYSVKPELCYVNYREAFSLPDRPAPQAGPDDGLHRPARHRGVARSTATRRALLAPLPSAADPGGGRRAAAAAGRADAADCRRDVRRAGGPRPAATAGPSCCAAWSARACWCWTPCPNS